MYNVGGMLGLEARFHLYCKVVGQAVLVSWQASGFSEFFKC